MLHLKIVLLTFALFVLVSEGQSQVSATDSVPGSASSTGNTDHNLLPLHKLNVNFQLGTQFMTTSGYGSGFSTFFSPSLSYPVSKRFLLRGGISIVNISLNGFKPYYSFPEERSFSGNITQAMLWFSGQYQLNERLTLTGTAYKTLDLMNERAWNSPFYKNNPQGIHLNIGYRINDYMHIDAGFGYSKGYNPYNVYDPFDTSPFGHGILGR